MQVRSPYQIKKERTIKGISPFDFSAGMADLVRLKKEMESIMLSYKESMIKSSAEFDNLIKEKEEEIQQSIYTLSSRMFKGNQGEPGRTPSKQELLALVRPLIPPPIKGKDGLNGKDGKNPEPEEIIPIIVDHLKEKKPLKVDHIDGLREEIASYRNQLALRGRGGGGGGQGQWNVKSLTGAIDGVNKKYTASAGNPPASNSHHVMLNYVEQNPLADYTVTFASGTITVSYTTAPDASLSGFPHYIRYL